MSADLKERIDTLSPDELQCLLLAARPLGSKQIGELLHKSSKTIDNRISRAMRKLGVSDRDSAIRLLIEASKTPWGKSLAAFSSVGIDTANPPPAWASRLPWPWPTKWRPENDHPFMVKLAIVVLLAAAMMLAVAAYLAVVILIDRSSQGRPSTAPMVPAETTMNVEVLDTSKRTNLSAARSVARVLLPAEEMIDRSIVASSQLLQQMAQARLEVGSSASLGQEAFVAASETIGALIEARDRMVQCHRELTDVRDALALEGSDVGCTASSPTGRAAGPARRLAAG